MLEIPRNSHRFRRQWRDSFVAITRMEQWFKSLTDGGLNVYKQSSTSLGNSHVSAAQLFRWGFMPTSLPHAGAVCQHS